MPGEEGRGALSRDRSVSLVVRPAGPADAEPIATIHVEAWRVAYAGILDPELLQWISVEERRDNWAGHLAAMPPHHHTHVAEAGGEVVGFCACGPTRDPDVPSRAEIYAIYIDPSWWGRGAGTALMEASGVALLGEGYTEAVLWVLEANHRARAFYEAAGWVADGANKSYESGATAVRYRSRLRRPSP
jgi:ribosomal protein S18 acetylase RimI-like enzyme